MYIGDVHSRISSRLLDPTSRRWNHLDPSAPASTYGIGCPPAQDPPEPNAQHFQERSHRRGVHAFLGVCHIEGRLSPCPVHAMIALLSSLCARGDAWVEPDAPLFPNAAGDHCTKIRTTAMFKAVGGFKPHKVMKPSTSFMWAATPRMESHERGTTDTPGNQRWWMAVHVAICAERTQ